MAAGDRSSGKGQKKTIVDFATLMGLVSAFALIYIAIIVGSDISIFVDMPSVYIVVGGTFAIMLASYSFGELAGCGREILRTFTRTTAGYYGVCYQLIQMAQLARSKGLLTLGQYTNSFKGSSLMTMGLIMLTDGMQQAEIESIMMRESSSLQNQKNVYVGLLRRAADLAPAMGLIGTLIGLVQMLGKLDNPNSIGPAMAVALITTFYGAVLSSVFFGPLANKLEKVLEEEVIVNQLYVVAISSMARQENPRRLEILMNSILPSNQRVKFFD